MAACRIHIDAKISINVLKAKLVEGLRNVNADGIHVLKLHNPNWY